MNHDHIAHQSDAYGLAAMGSDAVAYMKQVKASEFAETFSAVPDINLDASYWVLFAADGTPLMLASEMHELESSAFYNDLIAIRPN